MRYRWLPIAFFWLAAGPAHPQAEPEPVRLASSAFGISAQVEVRGLPRAAAEAAARAALHEIYEVSRLTDPAADLPGGVGALNLRAGRGPQAMDPRVAELLLRGLRFCLWSSGAHGPLGGELYQLWGEQEAAGLPQPTDLRWAVARADCGRLVLDFATPPTAVLAQDSRVSTVGMARGFAADRAAEVLKQHGVDNAWVEIGRVIRAVGKGPGGDGWFLELPPAPGEDKPVDQIFLQDQSLAIAGAEPPPGEARALWIDQRTGVPARGVVMVIAVADIAVDAEALSAVLFIGGLWEGQRRLGALEPRPSVYWLLGEGDGTPLQSTYRWSELKRVPNRYQ